MKSFPSAFTKNNLVQPGKIVSTNLQTTLKNIAGTIMNNSLGGASQISKASLGEYLKWDNFNYDDSIDSVDFANNKENKDGLFMLDKTNVIKAFHENVRKIPALTVISMNKYRKVFNHTAAQVVVTKGKDEKGATSYASELYSVGVSPSLFSGLYGVQIQGITQNTPLMTSAYIDYSGEGNITTKDFINETSKDERDPNKVDGQITDTDTNTKIVKKYDYTTENKVRPQINITENSAQENEQIFVQLNNDDFDFTDCSIKTLVALSNATDPKSGGPIPFSRTLGRATYRYADFMYCKELGKISNNHLITLRKFDKPIGDNIFKRSSKTADREIGCVGTLVTWFGTEDNKLEDICKYNYEATWKEMHAELETIDSKEDNSKILPSLVNIMNPQYNKGVMEGKWGGGNAIYGWIAGHSSVFKHNLLDNTGSYENDGALYHMDKNKIYEPTNVMKSTHLYEGELKFSNEFNITFNYTLRSYDGINPKSALLDLLGNIMNITYKEGKFWGGARRWCGAPRNQAGWNKINDMFNKIESGIDSAIGELFGCSSWEDLQSLCSGAFQSFCSMCGDLLNKAVEVVKDPGTKDKVEKHVKQGAKVMMGMLKNKLGRPAIYAMNSILKGDNVGLWHVTIGNPRNPIMVMGNMILTKSEITHYGPLGVDDFPTNLKLVVTLKHARPRDSIGIGEMYTMGQGGLVYKLSNKTIKTYYLDNALDESLGIGGYGDILNTDIENVWSSRG